MTAMAEDRRPARGLPRWALVLAGGVMILFLLAPPAAGLLSRRPAAVVEGQRLPAGQQPTDVAVDGSTVWVVSGRDNRVVALDARDAKQAPQAHAAGSSPLRLAIGQGSVWTANAGDDTVTRLDPLVPGSGRRIRIGSEAVDIAVSPAGAGGS